jgi:hypothetical protein
MRAFTPKTAGILVSIIGVSLLVSLTGLSLQLAWIGQPLGAEGGTVGDVSAGVFLAAGVAAFIFAARTQDADVYKRSKRPGH